MDYSRKQFNEMAGELQSFLALHAPPQQGAVKMLDTFTIFKEGLQGDRRYENIAAPYMHPNAWLEKHAYCLSSALARYQTTKEMNNVEVNILSASIKLMEEKMPYYYVSENYLRSVAATAMPQKMMFGEMEWPREGLIFGVPSSFMKEYTGYDVDIPFIAAAFLPHSRDCDITHTWPDLGRMSGIDIPLVRVDVPRVVVFFADFNDYRKHPDIAAMYSGTYTLDMDVNTAATDEFKVWSHAPELASTGAIDREAEAVVNRKVVSLAIKLLIVLACEPEWIVPGNMIRKPSTKHGRTKPGIWSNNFIGRSYVHHRDLGGTHESPVGHIRRSHVIRQAIGPRDKLVKVSDLPYKDGRVDWDQVTDEMRSAFYASHKSVRVKDVRVMGGPKGQQG